MDIKLMDKEHSYNLFWNSFGLKAYDESSVPDRDDQGNPLSMPYITYELSTDTFDHPVALTASLWYRSTSWIDITNKLKQIESVIGRGGIMIKYDAGAAWIRRGTPWSIRMSEDGDDSVRRIVMNLEVEFID